MNCELENIYVPKIDRTGPKRLRRLNIFLETQPQKHIPVTVKVWAKQVDS